MNVPRLFSLPYGGSAAIVGRLQVPSVKSGLFLSINQIFKQNFGYCGGSVLIAEKQRGLSEIIASHYFRH